jgi:hypothetical protein
MIAAMKLNLADSTWRCEISSTAARRGSGNLAVERN